MNGDSNDNQSGKKKSRPKEADDFRLAKEVNKRLRQERRSAKKQRPQRDAGKLKHVMQDARRKHAGDPKAQAAHFLAKAPIPAGIGRRRFIGDKRQDEWGRFLKGLPDELREARVPIQNLDEISGKHVAPLVRLWEKRGLSEGYIGDLLSILRRFLALIGKSNAVPSGAALKEHLQSKGIVAGTIGRSSIAKLPKGWRDMGVDPTPIIEAMRVDSEVMASHLEVMETFGARCVECIQMQPRASDKGDFIIISRGTKGGKTRMVKFSANPKKRAHQRAVLDRAIAVADKNPKGELAEPGLTLKQMKKRQRYIFQKFGLTKKKLGIVPHGLRHQFASDLFFELTGLPAPVLGLIAAEVYQSKWLIVKDAYLEISREMGHERVSITGAYGGTPGNLGRQQNNRLGQLLGKIRGADSALEAAGATDCWILGRPAAGMELLPGERLQVAVRLADQTLSMRQVAPRMEAVRKALEDAAGEHVSLSLWLERGIPPDAAETMYSPSVAGTARSPADPSAGVGCAA